MADTTEALKSSKPKGDPERKPSVSYGAGIFLKLSKYLVYTLVFLLPLFFLPWASNVLEFQKQTLLLFLVSISFFSFLTYTLISKRLEINFSIVNFPVALLLLVVLLSTFFSLSRYGSFWGMPLPVATSFLSILALAALYFVITNLFRKEEIHFLLLTLFTSGFFAAVFFIAQLFSKFFLPFNFSRQISFNTIGSVNSLAIYFSVLLILLLPLLFYFKNFFRIALGASGLALLAALFLINFQIAWLILTAGTGCLLALSVARLWKTGRLSLTALLTPILIISLFFAVFRFSLPREIPTVPLEILPSNKASVEVLEKLPVKSWILGSGPGTFFYEWLKKKPQSINETIFWGIRFLQPSSVVIDRIIGTGILGILAFFFLAAACFKLIFADILKKTDTKLRQDTLNNLLSWGIFAGFVGLVLSFFLYPDNLSILFLFWLLVSFSALLGEEKKRVWSLSGSPLATLGASFSFVFILVLGTGLLFFYAQKYWAEVRYFQGLVAWQKGEREQSSDFVSKATNLNPRMDLYWRDLSQISMFRLQQLLARTDLTPEELRSRAEPLIAAAVNTASQATVVDPNNVANWNVRGSVYRNMIGILGEADNWALSSYERAMELEPVSPYIPMEIGRVYLAMSDLFLQQAREEERLQSLLLAKQNFEKAISLKADYAPAHFQIAMIHIRDGKLKEAIAKLEETKQVVPFDIGLAFQLGLIYYNDEQIEKAKLEFERAISIDPNYSNARYFLGLILDRQGAKQEAILQFEKIQEFNPDNQELKMILANLRSGKSALLGITPGQPPIEEKPPERLTE